MVKLGRILHHIDLSCEEYEVKHFFPFSATVLCSVTVALPTILTLLIHTISPKPTFGLQGQPWACFWGPGTCCPEDNLVPGSRTWGPAPDSALVSLSAKHRARSECLYGSFSLRRASV